MTSWVMMGACTPSGNSHAAKKNPESLCRLRNSIYETTRLTNEIVCFVGGKCSGSSRWGPTVASAPVTLIRDPPHLYQFFYVLFYISCLYVFSSFPLITLLVLPAHYKSFLMYSSLCVSLSICLCFYVSFPVLRCHIGSLVLFAPCVLPALFVL